MESSFEVLDFHNIAQILVDHPHPNEQARIRTAIGRIYYGAYLKIRRLAINRGFKEKKPSECNLGSHEQLVEWLKSYRNNNASSGKQNVPLNITVFLPMLKDLRRNSDYKDEIIIGKEEFKKAMDILKILKSKTYNSEWELS